MCFKKDKDLRMRFFKGWKNSINMKRLWLYLAIQGLGAIQWVDKQENEEVRKKNYNYRDIGTAILLEVYPILLCKFC